MMGTESNQNYIGDQPSVARCILKGQTHQLLLSAGRGLIETDSISPNSMQKPQV